MVHGDCDGPGSGVETGLNHRFFFSSGGSHTVPTPNRTHKLLLLTVAVAYSYPLRLTTLRHRLQVKTPQNPLHVKTSKHPLSTFHDLNTVIGGSCHKYHFFVATKIILVAAPANDRIKARGKFLSCHTSESAHKSTTTFQTQELG